MKIRLPATAIRTLTTVVVMAVVTGLASAKNPTVSTLAKCPPWGAEERGSSRGMLNEVKRRVPAGTTPTVLDFADIAALQRLADALVRSGPDLVAAGARAKLHDLAIGDRRVGEGDLVTMVGFLVGKTRVNVGETVNCYLTGASNNDFNLYYGPTPQTRAKDALVAEMIPQGRPAGWTVTRLRRAAGRRILVTGQLMFDSHHEMSEKSRVSLWEIHPVTRFLVCKRTGSECDPSHEDEWQTLESFDER